MEWRIEREGVSGLGIDGGTGGGEVHFFCI